MKYPGIIQIHRLRYLRGMIADNYTHGVLEYWDREESDDRIEKLFNLVKPIVIVLPGGQERYSIHDIIKHGIKHVLKDCDISENEILDIENDFNTELWEGFREAMIMYATAATNRVKISHDKWVKGIPEGVDVGFVD